MSIEPNASELPNDVEPPADYEVDLVSHRESLFFKEHPSGKRTLVHVKARGSDCSVTATDIRGDQELAQECVGGSEDRDVARNQAFEWMSNNPSGV